MSPFTQISNPVWATADQSAVNVDAVLNGETVPFTAHPNDPEDYGRAIYAAALAGDYGAVSAYVAPPLPAAPPRRLSFNEFIGLFTADEQAAIVDSTDTQVKIFLLMATGADYLIASDDRVSGGLALLVSKNLLTMDRVTAIVNAMK